MDPATQLIAARPRLDFRVGSEADVRKLRRDVRFVPRADIAAFGIAQLEIRSIGSYETLIQAVLNSSERGL
jgi:hypothetical protein